jgi:uncharacterized membrane protein
MRLVHIPRPLYNKFIILGFVYRLYVLGGIRLAASGPVLVQQPAAAGRVSASSNKRRAQSASCKVYSASKRLKSDSVRTSLSSKAGLGARVWPAASADEVFVVVAGAGPVVVAAVVGAIGDRHAAEHAAAHPVVVVLK